MNHISSLKKLLFLIVIPFIISCNNKTTNNGNPDNNVAEVPDSPAEVFAIDSIKFFATETDFSSISDKFQKTHENPKWKDNMTDEYAYLLEGFGYNNIKGIFSKPEGKLTGVVFRSTDFSANDTNFFENMEKLTSFLKKEFGEPTDIHSNLTENDIKQSGEVPNASWKIGKKSYTTTYTYDGEHFGVNLYIYRNDKLQSDSTQRQIDGELSALKDLM